jgi:hypothetical protein
MARTVIPVTTISRAGVAPPSQTASDHSNGMYVAQNNGHVIFEIISTDAGTQTVGFALPGTPDGQAIADRTITLSAGGTAICGPYPPTYYNQTDGSLNINPSVNTTLKFRAYKLPSN